jgi:hypothetical protein
MNAHDPVREYGFLGVVVDTTNLEGSIWTWWREAGKFHIEKTATIPPEPGEIIDPREIRCSTTLARRGRTSTRCGSGARCVGSNNLSPLPGSGFAISATEAADRQHLVTEDAIASAPTAKRITHAVTGAIGRP